MKTAFVWDAEFTRYCFRPDHPFSPKRLELTYSLVQALGLLDRDDVGVIAPRRCTDEELLRVHSPEYIEAVKRLSRPGAEPRDGWPWGLGTDDNPIFPGMHDAASLIVGGTMRAAEAIMNGEATRVFNVAGGLHHAHRSRASGFCVYSDLSAAIAWMRERFGVKVMYIDYDAHHGDGVQGVFYEDADVLTVSLHETGRYLFPGTGFVEELGEGDGYGYSINVPLEPFTEDESWLEIHRSLLPELAEAFRPDVIVVMNGVDGHVLDPLTHLRGTLRLYQETIALIRDLADQHCGGRLLATGGGGYDIWRVVPRAWTQIWAGLSEQALPQEVPREWLDQWQDESPYVLPTAMHDDHNDFTPAPRRAEIEATNRRTAAEVRRVALPLLRGWGMGF